MKVALVSPYDLSAPGGVQSHVRHLAAALRELGDEVGLVGPGDGTDHVTVGRAVRIPFNDSMAPIALAPAAGRRVVAALRSIRPDVVHVHEPLVPWVGPAAVRRPPAPVVATFHAWSAQDRAYRAIRPLGRAVLGGLAGAIAVSDAAAGYHAGALGVPVRSFAVVPNGVHVARFAEAEPLPEIAKADAPTLLFVGRLERRKGLELLIRAFTLLKTDRPELRLCVVGEGPERARCQKLLPSRLQADVVYVGRVSQEELPRYYRSCDLYVSPALGGESFGIVLLEAMAAGCPVVASALPGYASVVHDGVEGRLVPPGEVRVLAEAIGTVLDNPTLRAAMAAEGRRTVTRYDWPVVARRIRERYLAALA